MKPTREQLITECANNNKDAADFLRVFVDRAHWIDDLADQDGQLSLEPGALAGREMLWLVTLTQNPFFLKFKDQLLPVMLLGLNAWVDSCGMRGVQRDVVKGFYHEVAYAVAMLTGGWPHLRKVTGELRAYDIEEMATEAPARNGAPPMPEVVEAN